MAEDRRGAPRHPVPDGVTAEIGGIGVRLLELSLIGGKAEHSERFPLAAPKLSMTWRGSKISVAVRAARSEIVGRNAVQLVYHTGFYFPDLPPDAQGFIASILGQSESAPAPPVEPAPVPATPARSADDSWTRQVYLLRHELDEDLPYAQFRLTPTGWQKDYVATPAQPEDGFTINRERHDFDELQRTFEIADGETRRMMQIALESQLHQKAT
jgi:hypothetical protein